jgi:hypothetical protein
MKTAESKIAKMARLFIVRAIGLFWPACDPGSDAVPIRAECRASRLEGA